MKIADNPLSRNLSKRLGTKFNDEFKDKTKSIREKIREKFPDSTEADELTDGSIKNWLIEGKRKGIPHRLPKLANLIKIAEVLEIDFWDLFVNEEKWLNRESLSGKQKRIIEMLPHVKNEKILEAIISLCEAGSIDTEG